jgi:hypothetical protein
MRIHAEGIDVWIRIEEINSWLYVARFIGREYGWAHEYDQVRVHGHMRRLSVRVSSARVQGVRRTVEA